ncbi:hypothetical protein FACS1894190_17500 [Spirochaetia bacterium]|nr:hypothetical protein FACS1894190_17500 [Spirochaetia bacterium]
MDSHYDLTTQDGMKKASEWFDSYGWLISPLVWAIKRLLPPTAAEQARAAGKLIEVGKNHGVKDMTIYMNDDAYGKLKGDIKNEDIKVTAKAGSNRQMKITVNYS